MMLERVISWVLVVQHYFLWLCRYTAIYVKRLASLTFPDGTSVNGKEEFIQSKKTDLSSDSEKKQKGLKPITEIPGPKCLPVIGSLLDFNQFGPRRVHELSKERHEKYGDIFREKLLSQEMVFIANTELMKQWMLQEGKMPSSLKQEPSSVWAREYPDIKRGLFFRNGEEWYLLRKLSHFIILKSASDFDVCGLFDGCRYVIENYMKDLAKHSDEPVDLEVLGYDIAVGALMAIVFGKTEDKLKSQIGTDYKTISANAKELNRNHQLLLEGSARMAKLFNTKAWNGYHTKLSFNLRACNALAKLLREEIKQNPEACSMSTHGLLYKTLGMNADPRDIDSLLSDFAADTKDPFAGTVMFVTQCLAKYPECQEKILEEVDRVYPNNEGISYGKLKDLEYTEAFFREALRLFPVAAFTARVALEDTEIGEYLIPPGTVLLFSTYVIQRDPRFFSEPDKFIPERWMKNSPEGLKCDHKAFGAFGLGQRICIGQNLAYSINAMYIANMVRNFKITSDLSDMEVEMKTVLYPKNPAPLHLEVRHGKK